MSKMRINYTAQGHTLPALHIRIVKYVLMLNLILREGIKLLKDEAKAQMLVKITFGQAENET